MTDTIRPCPHTELDADCPRCHGDGFTIADPLRAPGTDDELATAPVRGKIGSPPDASWLTLLLAIVVGFLIVLAASWWFSAAPRSSPDPVSAPSAGAVAVRPGSSGAPRETVTAVGAPLPAGGQVGGSLAVGKASWCAPTPKYCHGWGGRSLLAAVPGYDHVPYWAKVCRQDEPGRCVTVHVVSVCACGTGKVIDLTVYAFRDKLGGRLHEDGTLDVTVRGVRGPGISLPPTDVAP